VINEIISPSTLTKDSISQVNAWLKSLQHFVALLITPGYFFSTIPGWSAGWPQSVEVNLLASF
jgi:hypothetical protein